MKPQGGSETTMKRGKLNIPQFTNAMWQMPVADFLRMDTQQRAMVVEAMRLETNRRAREFKKAKLYSHGLAALKENLQHIGVSTNKMTISATKGLGLDYRNRGSERAINGTLLQAFGQYKMFFNPAETATNTVEGIEQVNREQDRLLFGTDEQGNPVRSMTSSQRRKFWEIVDAIRASDLITPADEYFYRAEGFQQLFFSGKFQHGTVARRTQMLVDYFESMRGQVPPTQPVEGEESVTEEEMYNARIEDLYDKYTDIIASRR